MPNIVIKDLEMSGELDREAMANIIGGDKTILASWSRENKTSEIYLGTRIGDDGWLYNNYRVRYQKVSFEDCIEIQERRV